MKVMGLSLAAIVCLSAASFAQALRLPLRYDRANELTVRGTVIEVRELGRAVAPRGTYLILRTQGGILRVHLGPRAGLGKARPMLAAGEPVEVVGSLARTSREEILLARQVRKGDTVLTFRSDRGFPVIGRHRGL
jgi:hypothetical protein